MLDIEKKKKKKLQITNHDDVEANASANKIITRCQIIMFYYFAILCHCLPPRYFNELNLTRFVASHMQEIQKANNRDNREF